MFIYALVGRHAIQGIIQIFLLSLCQILTGHSCFQGYKGEKDKLGKCEQVCSVWFLICSFSMLVSVLSGDSIVCTTYITRLKICLLFFL